jgi:hypothetical protein
MVWKCIVTQSWLRGTMLQYTWMHRAGVAQLVQWLGWGLCDEGIIIWFPASKEFFLLSKVSEEVLGAHQPDIQWVLWNSFLSVKWLYHDANFLTWSCVGVKNGWLCSSTSTYAFFFFLGPVCISSGSTAAFKAYCAFKYFENKGHETDGA